MVSLRSLMYQGESKGRIFMNHSLESLQFEISELKQSFHSSQQNLNTLQQVFSALEQDYDDLNHSLGVLKTRLKQQERIKRFLWVAILILGTGIPVFAASITGNFAIGSNTAPADTLDVYGDMRLRGTGGNAFIKDAGGTSRINIVNGGNLQLRSSTGANALQVSSTGAINTPNSFSATGSITGNAISSSGTIAAVGTVSASGGNSNNWNAAFGWGNHAAQTYPTVTNGNSRIVYGTVGVSGSFSGSGFTITKLSVGGYRINFTTSFTNTPIVMNTININQPRICKNYSFANSVSQVVVECRNSTNGVLTDTSFHFIAIGGR